MKKYLIKGLLALAVGGFTASCADKDGDYVPVGQQKAAAYADAFKELIGGEVAPNHDWGFKKTSIIEDFSQTRANTRAFTRADGVGEVIKPEDGRDGIFEFTNDEKNATGWRSPEGVSKYVAPITDAERAWVQAWFDNPDNRGLSDEGEEFHNFYVQQVYNKLYSDAKDNKKGYFWQMNNGKEEHTNKTYKVKMDQLRIGSARDEASTVHINDFNATDKGGNAWNAIYVKNGSSKQFAYWASYGSQWQWKFRCVELEVPASCFPDNKPHKGWYVGLSYYCDKVEIAGQKGERIGEDEIDICNDWILKIVPGDITPSGGETSSNSTSTRKDRVERSRLVRQGRIFCEDLGTNADKISKSDIDFNDAVFDAKIWRKGQFDVQYLNDKYDSESEYLEGIYKNGFNQPTGIDYNVKTEDVIVNGKFKYVAEICLLAAGGTVPLKIGGDNGFEIHDKFGKGQKSPRTISHTTIINTVGAPSQEKFTTTVSTDVCDDAVTVEVDITEYVKKAIKDGKTDIGLDIIPIDVEWVSGNYQSVGELSSEYGQAPQKLCVPIGTPWVYERIPITTAFKDFEYYAKEYSPSNPLTFWDLVKNTIDTNYLYKNGPKGMTAETGESGNIGSNPFYDEVIIKGPTTTITEVETVLWEGEMTFGAYANQTIKLYSTTFDAGNDIRIYGSSNGGQLTLQNSDSQPIISPSLNFSNVGYADSSVNENQAGQLSSGPSIIVVASNCTITKICKVVTTTN